MNNQQPPTQQPKLNTTTAAAATTTNTTTTTFNSRIDAPWSKEYESEVDKLKELQKTITASRKPSTSIVRVSQLDSVKLDEEILDLLKTQFMKIFSFFKPTFIQTFQPEINLILKAAIFKLSIFNLGNTYGNQLQNLTYRNEFAFDRSKGSDTLTKLTLRQKWASGLINIGGEWAWARINRISINEAWGERPDSDIKKKIWNLLNRLESLYKILSVLNFLTFLYDGKYVTLANRLLGMRLVYAHPSLSRRISFEYMNRQLVWHGFTEFFLFIMPLINIDKIKNFIYRTFIQKPSNILQRGNNGNNGGNVNAVSNQLTPEQMAPQVLQRCPICLQDPINIPYISDCGHLFCYYCIKTSYRSFRMCDLKEIPTDHPYGKIVKTTVLGGFVGALIATNQTYPKTPFITNDNTEAFLTKTYRIYGRQIIAGSLIGLSYASGKRVAEHYRETDDAYNIIAGSMAATVAVGIHTQNWRITSCAFFGFLPIAYCYKLVTSQIDKGTEAYHNRLNTEKRTDLFLAHKIQQDLNKKQMI
ncbi:RING zinc finger-containing protein [Cavenderia fasciculata]|uniref:RING-type E3 ubiquitin transferase (cysteine targeting) n=1 Tax=Cavenderia fasciculata TaxID=261658 RepID=F4PW50_CACFS|nr:RING zinc finger-containing protein [Cavenderia fasciculata]EGG20214.1 RING zinc finger-containing protein [Cavenderia fasciculata]|eukprot:XP_004367197.1 RING zinc finger-containing protein [Cavenderia fasciculata]